jgi:hypothetical protein
MADCLPGLLYWLALVPTAVFLGLETQVKRVIGGRLRVYNAVDLSVMTVFYHVLFEVRVCGTPNEAANGRVCGAQQGLRGAGPARDPQRGG